MRMCMHACVCVCVRYAHLCTFMLRVPAFPMGGQLLLEKRHCSMFCKEQIPYAAVKANSVLRLLLLQGGGAFPCCVFLLTLKRMSCVFGSIH